jgi:hypothetical protein
MKMKARITAVTCLGAAMLMLLAADQDTKRAGDAYPLTTCPISGRTLGENAVVVVLSEMPDAAMNGREVRFCCNGCRGKFEKEAATQLPKLDELIIKDQLKVYPVTNCIVMTDDELADPRSPEAMEDKNVVIGNRLYRFCCKGCIRKFKKDPKTFSAELDKIVIEQQSEDYPLDVCVVTGSPYGDKPFEFVVANRLVRTCCGGCAGKVRANPTDAITKVDGARAAKTTKTSR